ncbi:hypothetical protein M2139_001362 [Enterococcus sp. PF1-24]|uniref:hypothetical protein n=1 Tax=unclassified Enterococcus TaxID=2608891 RepID=UPI0024734BA4|nr:MULTISPECIES: hypothetical protein [unclassified Enterococcus]MDH6364333.1 hypothetical protein [Enterococcus sp. PFB1-1]MDH6401478.1 hypothetical protein [Enterococcus sp. PF1-24]
MTTIHEGFLIFFMIFGASQIIYGLIYLLKKNGLTLAKKHYQFLLPNATDKQIKNKIYTILLTGIAFFILAIQAYFSQQFPVVLATLVLVLFVLSAAVDAFRYKRWQAIVVFLIDAALLATFLIFT